MSFAAIATVFRKELTDTLRDRRTIVSMFVVPLVIMPLLVVGFGTVATMQVRKARAEVHDIVLIGAAQSPAIVEALRAQAGFRVVETPPDWRERIADRRLRAAVQLPDDYDARLAAERPAEVRLFWYRGDLKSGLATDGLEKFFEARGQEERARRLDARGLPRAILEPVNVARDNVAPPERVAGSVFGGMIPYIVIMLALSGAMYPAIDLTAGEKERGTMETLLTCPVRRLDLVLGKLGVVLGAAFVALSFSLVSMGASVAFIGNQLVSSGLSFDPVALLVSLVLLLPLVVLLCSILLTLALFARTQKEAQSYISPVLFLSIFGVLGAMVPGLDLNLTFALIPILNVSLACREMLTGVYNWPLLGLIFGTTLLYAAAGLALCVQMFKKESVLFRS